MKGITNGFRVYSPNGATWNTTVGDTLSSLVWGDAFDLTFNINYFSVNGAGADTVAFGGSKLFGNGLPTGFVDTAYSLRIGPVNSSHLGKTICIDSSFFPPVGYWVWAPTGTSTIIPDWYGPYCFTVTDQITFRGNLYYWDPVPPDTSLKPMRGVRIEMWDNDSWPFSDQLLGTDTADDNGGFHIGPVSNSDDYGLYGQDVFFRIYAQNEAAYLTVAYNGDRHLWQTAEGSDLEAGIYDTTMACPLSESGAFFVADAILDGYRMWIEFRPDPADNPGDSLQVVLQPSNSVAFYDPTNDYIYINSADSVAQRWPDTYDRGIILHEYGHKIEFSLGFMDDTTDYPSAHNIYDRCNQETAAIEGFAWWFSCQVRNDPVWIDFFNNYRDTGWINIENGEYGLAGVTDSFTSGSMNALGMDNEGTVAGILWDIYDGADDDYSDSTDWGTLNIGHGPDGIGDSLADGATHILAALLDDDRKIDGHHPDNIEEFWDAWFTEPALGHPVAMGDIWYEHGDSTHLGCCMGDIRGNVNYDPYDHIDIADLVYLTDYMFDGGPVPPCFEEADIDACQAIDIADLVVLVDYVFSGGDAPWPCP